MYRTSSDPRTVLTSHTSVLVVDTLEKNFLLQVFSPSLPCVTCTSASKLAIQLVQCQHGNIQPAWKSSYPNVVQGFFTGFHRLSQTVLVHLLLLLKLLLLQLRLCYRDIVVVAADNSACH